MSNFTVNRRRFLQYAGCGAMSASTLMSSVINLRALQASAALNSSIDDDYRALVCIGLAGGNDSYNMLIPTSSSEYDAYAETRSNVAISRGDIIDLAGNTSGRTFGLHPSMPRIAQMYQEGNAGFLANVGTLVEPLTMDDFFLSPSKRPLGLLSHSDQYQQWQTAIPHERSAIGWVGKISELISDAGTYNSSGDLPMNISLEGTNIIQSGSRSDIYAINPNEGPVGFYGYERYPVLRRSLDKLLETQYNDVFKKTYLKGLRDSRDAFVAYRRAFDNVNLSTSFSNLPNRINLPQSLYQVARAIASSAQLGFKRQTFFVELAGFDTHDDIGADHARLLRALDTALFEFQSALKELNAEDKVVTFTISDFARTMGSNGNGTDHAWGGHMLMMGGPVKGGKIYGKYPETVSLNDNPDDLGGGIILPSTSADEYFAELALWFGVNPSDLGTVFPNLVNFYDYRSAGNNLPIGFLTQ